MAIGHPPRIGKARLRVHLSQYDDETSELCQWHLPETHYLETWGDARAFDVYGYAFLARKPIR